MKSDNGCLDPAHAIEDLLRSRIAAQGPIPFDEFMRTALYEPGLGYYTGPRDPFGRDGDFFTAAQIQPVFGRLIAQWTHDRFEEMGRPRSFRFVDLGAGRMEMRDALAPLGYTPVLPDKPLPADIHGVVFANEFFDALPVRLARAVNGEWRELLVAWRNGSFFLEESDRCAEEVLAYLDAHRWSPHQTRTVEVRLEDAVWLDRVYRAMHAGVLLVIDYGYTERERIRFPEGTLMGYRRHQADESVLRSPGRQDITAHVDWTAFESAAKRIGWTVRSSESFASFLLSIGERDQFAEALAAEQERDSQRLRLQLKTLLFGMGESFRVMLLSR